MAVWELLAPRRRSSVQKPPRWFGSLGLVVLNTLSLRLLAPVGLTGVALVAQSAISVSTCLGGTSYGVPIATNPYKITKKYDRPPAVSRRNYC